MRVTAFGGNLSHTRGLLGARLATCVCCPEPGIPLLRWCFVSPLERRQACQ